MLKFASVSLALAALLPLCHAVETKSWIQNEQQDFDRGTLTRLALRSDGRLSLAPVFKELLDSSTPYLWAIAADSKGNLYTGGGGPSTSNAVLYRIDASGKSKPLAELPGMEIHAIAIDSKDNVFAATAPDGKVYRVNAAGKSEVFYDPKAKYIWALAFDKSGNLFVATGDQGEVHRVTPDGKGSVFFQTEETHARSLAVDAKGNLIVGTEPGGVIIRVSPAGQGYVLYQSPKREVTALAVANDGAIYAAAVGNKNGGSGSTPPPSAIAIPPTPLPGGGQRATPAGPQAPPPATITVNIAGGSEVYRIETDDFAHKIWSSGQDVVYAIGFDSAGHAILGTGNKGKIFRVDSDVLSTLLVNAQPTQITAFCSNRAGALFAATGNIGKVYQLGPELEKSGTYESDPFDAGFFSYWGRLSAKGDATFETRSGNLDRPQKNWSAWAPVTGRVTSPAARFLQYRATLSNGKSLSEVDIAYLTRNVPPTIEEIEITPPNYRFPAPSNVGVSTQSITLPAMGQRKKAPSLSIDSSSSSQSMNYARGSIGARWLVSDPNGDDLIFKVEIRGTKETEWKLFRDKVKEKYLSWDSLAFPDGEYVLRVTASDAPSNAPGQALTGVLESDPFIIDNTPPQIIGLTGNRSGNKITARFKAKDALSVITNAEYSIDGKEWLPVEPTTRLSDSLEHDYVVTIDGVAPGEHVIAVRATDEFENQSVEKTVVR